MSWSLGTALGVASNRSRWNQWSDPRQSGRQSRTAQGSDPYSSSLCG